MEVERYQRTPSPQLKESKERYLEDELRKLQKVLDTVYDAIKDIQTRLTTGGL